MFRAYKRVIKLSETDGGLNIKVNIIDVMNELVIIKQSYKFHKTHTKNEFRSYPRSFFLYDLSQLIQQKIMTYNNYKLSFTSATIEFARKRDKVIDVPDLKGGSRAIMLIEFRKDK